MIPKSLISSELKIVLSVALSKVMAFGPEETFISKLQVYSWLKITLWFL